MTKRAYGLIGGASIARYTIAPALWRLLRPDVEMTLFSAPSERDVRELLDPASGFAGFNVARPYKALCAAMCAPSDECTAALASCNTIAVLPSGPRGWNTDGAGLCLAMEGAGYAVRGSAVLLLGLGGAGQAAALELAKKGAAVWCFDNDEDRQNESITRLTPLGVRRWEHDRWSFDAVVNATPLGMSGGEAAAASPLAPADAERMNASYWIEMNYNPLRTAFLTQGLAQSAITVPGVSMLYHQAVLSAQHVLGQPPAATLSTVVEQLLASGAILPSL